MHVENQTADRANVGPSSGVQIDRVEMRMQQGPSDYCKASPW